MQDNKKLRLSRIGDFEKDAGYGDTLLLLAYSPTTKNSSEGASNESTSPAAGEAPRADSPAVGARGRSEDVSHAHRGVAGKDGKHEDLFKEVDAKLPSAQPRG